MRILGAFQTIVGLSALLSVVGARVAEAQGVTFALSSSTNQPGASVTASLTVSGFDEVGGAQFSLKWDPTVLSYVGLANYGLNYLAAGNFGTAPALTTNGELSCSWDDQSGSTTGTTVPDGTVMFTISFVVIGSAGTSSSLALVDVPTARQVFSAGLAPLDFISVDGQVQVRSRPEISAWPTASSITYGQALAASALSGGVASVAGSFAFDTPETTPGVGAYGASVTFTPADTVDYPSVTNTVLVNVDPAPLTITAGAQTKTYGQALNLGTTAFTTTGLLNGDAVTAVALTSPGAAATAAVAGSPYLIAASVAVGTGLANYNIFYQPGSLTVNPAGLTIAAGAQAKTYGQPLNLGTTAFTTTGLLNGDAVTAVALTSPGAAATAAVAGSPYLIAASVAVGTGLANYNIFYQPGSLTVNPAGLTIAAGAQAKTYGQPLNLGTTAFTTTGLLNGDAVTAVALTSPGAAATAAVAGSPYLIAASVAVGTGLANYNIFYQPGSLTVNPAGLTIAAGAQAKTYGQPLNLGTAAFTTTGLLNGDAVTAVALTSPGAAATAAVAGSPYSIAASAAVGTGLANYNIFYQPSSLTVNPAPLTVTGNNATRLYGAANPPFTGTIAGLQNGDLVSATFVALTDPTSPVGNYTITASLSGAASTLDNYTLSITLGTLTVLPATPSVTWTNPAPITYGAALSSVQLNATPSVPGTVVYTPPAGTVLPAGTNTLSLAFSPTDATDYSSLAAGVTLLVLPAPLTITANNATRPYGAANPPFTGTITGIQNSDNITATYTCSAGPTTAPGAYPIVPAPVSPGNLQTNYQVTLVDGTLTVLPASPPAVVVQPTNQVVGLGQIAMFAVGATGTGPLSYRWQLHGANLADSGRIAGSQSNLLALAGLLLSDAGNYQAVITNAYGSVTSAVATLTVLVPPLLQAVAQSNGTVTFSWSATPGQSYQVQYASDLTQPNWTNLVIITATNSTATASDAVGSSAHRFYRTLWSP